MAASDTTSTHRGKALTGTVVSDKMDKTVTVEVHRYVRHPKYGKFIRSRKRYKAHDPENAHQKGDRVTIRERRRASKDKAFEIAT